MSDDPRLGTTLADRYRLNDLLGEGGMGKVYAAEHVLMRKRLAVKILHRELTTVPEVVKRFEREAMAAAHIEHPNVAAATDFGKLPDGSVFLVLEFVHGELLRDEVAKGPLQVERALHIARQIASALASAHELEIVHRDLKPENVMLVEKGGDPNFVKVLDFGIAKVPIGEIGGGGKDGQVITRAGMVFGTPEYMAPEQALGQPVDGRADLYALGVMLYEMLAGVRPFSSQSQVGILGQQLANPVPSFAKRAPGIEIPLSVEQLVVHLLEKEADQRFESAVSVVEAIDALVHPAAVPGRLFTKMGGSPRSVLGSRPELDSAPESGPIELPAFSTESDSGRMLRAGLESSPDQLPASPGLDPIGPPPGAARVRVTTAKKSPLARVAGVAEPLVRSVFGFVDAKREALPPRVRSRLASVPTPALVLGGALAALGILTVLVALIVKLSSSDAAPAASNSGGASTSASAPAPSVAPVEDPATQELKKAEAAGLEALEALAKKQGNDARVWVALAAARLDAKKYSEAVAAVSQALEVDPKLNTNDKIASLLFTTAQSKAASTRTFELLEGPMGSRGADIVYDIALQKGVRKSVKSRADRFLRSKDFARASSPALNIAVALRNSRSCRASHGLLLRAKNVGDARSLTYLEPMTKKDGCGEAKKSDCYPCMRHDTLLEQATTAIQKRSLTK